jgi:MoxR-like ATPase
MRLARAYAFLNGRDYVIPEDVAALYMPCIAHRLVLSQESRLNRLTVEKILEELFRSIEVPYRTGRGN